MRTVPLATLLLASRLARRLLDLEAARDQLR